MHPIVEPIKVYSERDIDVWRVNLDVDSRCYQALLSILSPIEKLQFSNSNNLEMTDRFRVRRGYLRHLLSNSLTRAPQEVSIQLTSTGKPYIEGNPVFFNSTSRGCDALIALSKSLPVGVDLECVDSSFPFDSLIRDNFSPTEQALLGLDPQNPSSFFQAWTHKEASAKAEGTGLSRSLKEFVIIDPHTVVWNRSVRYRLFGLELNSSLIGSLAIRLGQGNGAHVHT